MEPERRRLLGLFGRALLLLPPFLVAWWLASGPLGLAAGQVARLPIGVAAGPAKLASGDGLLHYEVAIASVRDPLREAGAVVELEVKPGTYTFGIALFLALALASRESRRAGRIAIGAAILVVLPAWGIAFDVLRQLAATGPLVPMLGWAGPFRNFVALGYQAGSLLVPTLGPIAAWMALNPEAWREADATAVSRSAG